MDIFDLRNRFHKTAAERLFDELKSAAIPKIAVSQDVEDKLGHYLDLARQYCSDEWGDDETIKYRARKHSFGQFQRFASCEMGAPPVDYASVGRAQPAGMSMLYLADNKGTAIAEVKPDVGQYVTVATYRVKSDEKLKILDLSRFKAEAVLQGYEKGGMVISELSDLVNLSRHAFSGAVHPDDPRKYHAQAFFVQKAGEMRFDGIGYESAVDKGGRCFALFDEARLKCTQTQLHQVRRMSLEHERVHLSQAERQHIAGETRRKK